MVRPRDTSGLRPKALHRPTQNAAIFAKITSARVQWRVSLGPPLSRNDFVFPRTRLKGRKPLSASILVQKYLRPAAVKAGIIEDGQKIRFGFHNFRHSLASALVKMKVDPKTVQEFLRQAHVSTTLQLYAQSDMESKRDAQGMFLKQMLGDRMHLLTEGIQ